MRDKRPVDELSIEELERILAIRKREARRARLHRYEQQGRRVMLPQEKAPPQQHENAAEISAPAPPAYDTTEDAPHFEDEMLPEPTYIELTKRSPAPIKQRKSEAPAPEPRKTWDRRRRRDRLLLLVEVAAVIGLVAIVVNMLLELERFNRETAQIQEQARQQALAAIPTVTPTPQISIRLAEHVLPGGHTFNASGEARFAMHEIPENLRPYAKQALEAPEVAIPTAAPESPVWVRIPAIGVDDPVYQGDDWNTLQLGIGHHIGSANPGQTGNVVLSAHNDVFGEIFRRLDELKPGDIIYIRTASREYQYITQATTIVDPTQVGVMAPTHSPVTTLISCYPYRVNDKRIVVSATLQE